MNTTNISSSTVIEQRLNKLIKGADLTNEQKSKLRFNGMANEDWVISHSFWFDWNNEPCTEGSGCYYPVCHSVKYLSY